MAPLKQYVLCLRATFDPLAPAPKCPLIGCGGDSLWATTLANPLAPLWHAGPTGVQADYITGGSAEEKGQR